jgi:hypothetical protein
MSEQKYRELGPDEVIREGDESEQYLELWGPPYTWQIGRKVGDFPPIKFRRPIPAPVSPTPDLTQLAELRAENERLREALKNITAMCVDVVAKNWPASTAIAEITKVSHLAQTQNTQKEKE